MKPEYWQNDSAKFYDEIWSLKKPIIPARYANIFKFLLPYFVLECWSESERSVLEIGCAVGHTFGFLKMAFPYTVRYEALDISPHHIEKARQLYPEVTFHQCDAKQTDFGDASFNVVLAVDVLLHNRKVEMLLNEWYRIARHCLIIFTRTIDSRPSLHAFQSSENGENAPYHILNTKQLVQMFAGFDPDYIIGIPWNRGGGLRDNIFGLPPDLKKHEVGSHIFFILKDLPKEADVFIRQSAPTG